MAKHKSPWIVRTQAEVAEFFDVSVQTVGVWKSSGMSGRGERWDLQKIVKWLRSAGPWRPRGVQRLDVDTAEEFVDRARLLRAQADLKEMQVEERAGRLCPADMVEALLGRIADGLRGLGDDFGRSAIPITGRDAQKKVNDMISSIDWTGEASDQ